ncbi:CLUMA_CG013367, isoform A [Clunio marinus]|uniref:RNA-binding protein 42 n=1 Tax=Clunio marinus TaxID=568069 RepID=A0A1J1IIM5_9DIPT|nr:CLUMA_CG013367, isoform A [Clunio marinus]
MGTKRKNMEDEMSRFESEINQVANIKPMFVPSQVKQFNAYNTAPHKPTISKPPMSNNQQAPSFNATFQPAPAEKTPIILSSAPKLYSRPNVPTVEIPITLSTSYGAQSSSLPPPSVGGPSFNSMPFEAVPTAKIKKSKSDKSQSNHIAEDIIKAAKASSALQSFGNKDKKKIDKKTVRQAGGITWEDQSLADWPDDDFRIFCGDLGNDVNDELLTRTFSKYLSFQRAKVIRDKRTSKSKGYGFISFKEPQDFIRAMKEMDGRYVGSRPIKLRKSTWKQRGMEERRKKDAEKKALLSLINN